MGKFLMPVGTACFKWYNFHTKCDMIDFVFRKGLIHTTFSWGGRRSCQGHSESMIQTSSLSGQKFMVLVREMMMMMLMTIMTVQFSSCLLFCWLNRLCASYKTSTATQIQHKYTKTKLTEKRTKHITTVAKLSTGARVPCQSIRLHFTQSFDSEP